MSLNNKANVQTKGTSNSNTGPLIQLQGCDNAPVINPNIPEPTEYSGRYMTELRFFQSDEDNKQIFQMDAFTTSTASTQGPTSITLDEVIDSMKNGFSDQSIFPLLQPYAGVIRLTGDESKEISSINSIPTPTLIRQVVHY